MVKFLETEYETMITILLLKNVHLPALNQKTKTRNIIKKNLNNPYRNKETFRIFSSINA